MIFDFHVTLQDHVIIEAPYDVMVWISSREVTILPSVVVIGIVVVGIQHHAVKWSCDVMVRSPSRYVSILQSLMDMVTLVMFLVCHVISQDT